MAKLDVYVSQSCWSCDEARQILIEMRPLFPDITMELRDIGDKRRPNSVFATPTYILDGRTIFLGNPTRAQLRQELETACSSSGLS